MSNSSQWFMPFAYYNEWFKLMLQTSNMLMASGEVIGYRSQMIQQAMQGKLLWTNPEFTRLWQEKMTANMEASFSMAQSMLKQTLNQHKYTFEKQMVEGVKAVSTATRSYEKKAAANAKRLRDKN
jgi:hypothetical protein